MNNDYLCIDLVDYDEIKCKCRYEIDWLKVQEIGTEIGLEKIEESLGDSKMLSAYFPRFRKAYIISCPGCGFNYIVIELNNAEYMTLVIGPPPGN